MLYSSSCNKMVLVGSIHKNLLSMHHCLCSFAIYLFCKYISKMYLFINTDILFDSSSAFRRFLASTILHPSNYKVFSFFILQLIDGGRIQLCFLTLKAPFLKEFDVKEMDRCMMQFSKRFENARDVASRIC